MKRICNFILLLCLVQLAVAQNRIAEIRENLLGNHPDKILVVSHRADWRNAPENSLQGIQNCIDMVSDTGFNLEFSNFIIFIPLCSIRICRVFQIVG